MNRFGGVGPYLRQKRDIAELDLAIEYLCAVVRSENPAETLNSHAEVTDSMGGAEGVHGYLWTLNALMDDWDELLEIDGSLNREAISEEGLKLVSACREDRTGAIDLIL